MVSVPSWAGGAPAAPLGAKGQARVGKGRGGRGAASPRARLTLLLPRLKNKFVNQLKFDVTFTFSRLPLQVQHRAAALSMQQGLASLLFPSASCNKPLFQGNYQPR